MLVEIRDAPPVMEVFTSQRCVAVLRRGRRLPAINALCLSSPLVHSQLKVRPDICGLLNGWLYIQAEGFSDLNLTVQ